MPGGEGAEEADHALAGKGLVGGVGVEEVEENEVEGEVAGVGGEVGDEAVRAAGGGGFGDGAGVELEEIDALGLAVFGEGEAGFVEVADDVTGAVANDDVDVDDAGGGADGGGLLLGEGGGEEEKGAGENREGG